MSQPRILVFAYACEPAHGSEPGVGWEWARSLAHLGDTTVITRSNNRTAIEAALPEVPERDQLRFLYVDLPAWARFWKRGQRGIRLYYLLWQAAAVRTVRRHFESHSFDLVWHVTLANAWLGSLAPLAGGTFVYGPVGGGVKMPRRHLLNGGLRGLVFELQRLLARGVGRYLNPAARIAWRRAAVILVLNPETAQWLPRKYRVKAHVFPNAVLERVGAPTRSRTSDARVALFAGRLVVWKGPDLAIRAVARAPGWRLLIHGTGRDEARLRRLAQTLGVEDRVAFGGWIQRDALLDLMRNDIDVLLFPSLHDDSPWIVAEALGAGLPVVCVNRGGPPIIAGSGAHAVETADAEKLTRELAAVLRRNEFASPDALVALASRFTREQHVRQLRQIVSSFVEVDGSESLE